MQRIHRPPVARCASDAQLRSDSLLTRSLVIVADTLNQTNSTDSGRSSSNHVSSSDPTATGQTDLARLPSDLLQMIVDHLCFHQSLSCSLLERIGSDAAVAASIHRLALRAV